MAKTKTAKQVTIRQDTVGREVIKQQVYQFKADSVYIQQQDSTMRKMDAVLSKRKMLK